MIYLTLCFPCFIYLSGRAINSEAVSQLKEDISAEKVRYSWHIIEVCLSGKENAREKNRAAICQTGERRMNDYSITHVDG